MGGVVRPHAKDDLVEIGSHIKYPVLVKSEVKLMANFAE